MTPGTFAAAAADGHYYDAMCGRCRHRTRFTARSICALGFGDVAVVGSQPRFRCQGCGGRGVHFTLGGYWTGVGPAPADWAETAEERMGGEG